MYQSKLISFYHRLGAERQTYEHIVKYSNNIMDVGWSRYRIAEINNIRQRILSIL